MRFFGVLLASFTCIVFGNCAKILAFFNSPSLSHQKIFQSLWIEMARRGHNVTAVSPNVLHEKSLKNLREVDVHHVYDILKNLKPLEFLSKDALHVDKFLGYSSMMQIAIEDVFMDETVQKLFHSDENFDVLVIQAAHPLLFSIASRFKVPVIGELEKQVLAYIIFML